MLALPNYMIGENAPVNVPEDEVIEPKAQEDDDEFHDAVGEEEK
jgi:hypothetical protein